MAVHWVKSWPQFFQPMLDGTKRHDMRNMRDRVYEAGDTLILQEYDPFKGEYTGRQQGFRITYITSKDTPCALSSAMLDDDACILSLEKLGGTKDKTVSDHSFTSQVRQENGSFTPGYYD